LVLPTVILGPIPTGSLISTRRSPSGQDQLGTSSVYKQLMRRSPAFYDAIKITNQADFQMQINHAAPWTFSTRLKKTKPGLHQVLLYNVTPSRFFS